MRAQKVQNVANDIPDQGCEAGEAGAKLCVLGWGSTFGAINQAVTRATAAGKSVAHVHLRNIVPFPKNLGELLKGFDKVIVPEMNNGMLSKVLRAEYLVDAIGVNKIAGQPFKVAEIEAAIAEHLEELA